jgi:hypothetical protein
MPEDGGRSRLVSHDVEGHSSIYSNSIKGFAVNRQIDITSHFLYILKNIVDGVVKSLNKIPWHIRLFLIYIHDASVSP